MADSSRTEGRPAPPPKPTARQPGTRPKVTPRVPAKPQPPVPRKPPVSSRATKPTTANGLPTSKADAPVSKVPPPLPSVPPCASRPEGSRNLTPPPRTSTPTERSDDDSAPTSRNSSPVPEANSGDSGVPRKPAMAGMVRVLPMDLILAKSRGRIPPEDDNVSTNSSKDGDADTVDPPSQPDDVELEASPAPSPVNEDESAIQNVTKTPEQQQESQNDDRGGNDVKEPVQKLESTPAKIMSTVTQSQESGAGSRVERTHMMESRRSESPVPPNTVLISGINPEDLRKDTKKPAKPKPLAKPSIKPKPTKNTSQFYVGLGDRGDKAKGKKSTAKNSSEKESKSKTKPKPHVQQLSESEVIPPASGKEDAAAVQVVAQAQNIQIEDNVENVEDKVSREDIDASKSEESLQTEDKNIEIVDDKTADKVNSSQVPPTVKEEEAKASIIVAENDGSEKNDVKFKETVQVGDDSPKKPPRRKKKSMSQNSLQNQSFETQTTSVDDKENSRKQSKSSPQKHLQKQENFDKDGPSEKQEAELKRVPSRKAPPPPGPHKKVLHDIDIESRKSNLKKTESRESSSTKECTSNMPADSPENVETKTGKLSAGNSLESDQHSGRDQSPGRGSIQNLAAAMGASISQGLQHQLTSKGKPRPTVKPKPKPPLLKPKPKLNKSTERSSEEEEKSVSSGEARLSVKDDKRFGRNSSYSKALDVEGEAVDNKTSEKNRRRDSYSRALASSADDEEGEGSRNTDHEKKPVIPGMVRVLPIDLKMSKVNIKVNDDNEIPKTEQASPRESAAGTSGKDEDLSPPSDRVRDDEPVFVPPPPPDTATETKMLQFPSVEDEQNNRLSQQIPIAMLDDVVFKDGEKDEDRESAGDDYYEEVEVKRDDFNHSTQEEDTENIYEPPPDLPPKNHVQRPSELCCDTPPVRPPKRRPRHPPPVPIQSPPISPLTPRNYQSDGSPPLPPRTFIPKSRSTKVDTSTPVDVSMRRSPSEMYDTQGYLEPVRNVPGDELYSYADVPEYPFEKKSNEPKVLRKRPEIGSPPADISKRVSDVSAASIRTSGGSHIYEPIISRSGSLTRQSDSEPAPSTHRVSGKSVFYFGIDEDDPKSDIKTSKSDEKSEGASELTEPANEPVTLDTPIPVPRAPPRLKTKRQKAAVKKPVKGDKKTESDGESSDSDYIYPDDPDFVKPQDSIYLKDNELRKENEQPTAVGSGDDQEEAIYHEADEPMPKDGTDGHEPAELSDDIYNEADDSALDSASGTTSGVASPEAAPPPIPPRDHHKSEPVPQAIRRALDLQRSTSTLSDSTLLLHKRLGKSIPKTVSFDSHMADSGLSLSPSGDEYMKSPDSDEVKISPRPNLRSISISSPNIGVKQSSSEDRQSGRPSSWASSADGYEDPTELRSGSFRKALCEDQESIISEIQTPGRNTSHGSGSSINSDPSDNSDDEEIAKERAEKRKRKQYFIAREIMTSEESFVDVLRLLNIDFRSAVAEATASHDHPVVPSSVMNQILQYLPQLQNFNEELLKDLKQRIDNWSSNNRVSDIFVRKGPFLKMYTFYIREFENSMIALDEARKKYPEFDATVKEFEASPRCKNLFIKHFMLKPIQRIPQYKLLLQDYRKYLREDHHDYKDTKTALAIVSEVADQANDSMKYGDNFKKLWEIQSALIGQFEVIKPGREFLKEGMLHKLSRKVMQPRMFFLFSDVLLYTTPVSAGYKLNNDIQLTGMRVNKPSKEDFQNEFSILSTQRSFIISASTPEEREDWLTALQDAIHENTKRRSSFDVRKLHKMPSVLVEADLDLMLGQRAPVWVPDARVSMCMLCTAEFSVTFRRHHCRACGKVVCGFCSDYRAPLRYLMYKAARVCNECYNKLSKDFDESDCVSDLSSSFDAEREGSFSKASIKAKFRGISWGSYRKASKAKRPAVLQEVSANDEAAEMSGYLKVWRNKKWKKLWFVLKGKIFYTYKASEDTAAIESTVLLGYEVKTFSSLSDIAAWPLIRRHNGWFEGVEPTLVFEISHQGTSPMVFRTESLSSRQKWIQAMQEATIP